MKRLLLVLLLMLAAAAGAIFALRDRITGEVVAHAFRSAETLAAGQGVALTGLHAETVRTVGLRTIVCQRVTGSARLARGADLDRGAIFTFGRLVVSIESVLPGRARVILGDGAVEMIGRDGLPTGQRVASMAGEGEFEFEWRHPARAAQEFLEELRALARLGECRARVTFEGVARFKVEGQWYDIPLRSKRAGPVMSLEMDPEDVRRISRGYVQPLTEAEIEIVARNPLRAPVLLRLSEQAAVAAAAERQRHESFPEDAYRHVYWSWLLTREFGPEFSEEVTDAHEIGPTYETGEPSRRMDLRNNAVGRAYALAGVPESELVARVLTDPNVQRALR